MGYMLNINNFTNIAEKDIRDMNIPCKSNDCSTVLGFRTSEILIQRLDELAQQDNRTRSQMARLLLEDALSRLETSSDT